jgi:hypothetical protein
MRPLLIASLSSMPTVPSTPIPVAHCLPAVLGRLNADPLAMHGGR